MSETEFNDTAQDGETFSQVTEKLVIFASLLAALPLFFLDQEVLGLRRFAWLVAMICGLAVNLALGPNDEMGQVLDKVTIAAVCVTWVPHFMLLIKDSYWFGVATVPPLFVVVHLSTATPVESEDFWRIRAFLHIAMFILPYLNHLPSPSDNKDDSTEKEETGSEVKTEETSTEKAPQSKGKSKKTAKHKK